MSSWNNFGKPTARGAPQWFTGVIAEKWLCNPFPSDVSEFDVVSLDHGIIFSFLRFFF